MELLGPTCEVCLDLIPNHLPTSRWHFQVAQNSQIESLLEFRFPNIVVSSRVCAICSATKDGVEVMFRGQPGGLNGRKCFFVVHLGSPFEVEICGADAPHKEDVRMQFFVQEGKYNNPATFGFSRAIAPLISPTSHSSLIKSWIANCLENHSICGCKSGHVLPTRLLDISGPQDSSVFLVQTKTLPISSEKPLYVTLSHCWGKNQPIKTISSNLGSFQQGISFGILPRTFQDAISIARELSINYLWIDSLCIIQDSVEDWKHELALMASIYSASYLNIAATGVSDSSLPILSSRESRHQCFPVQFKHSKERNAQQPPEIFVRASLNKLHKFCSTPSRKLISNPDIDEHVKAPLLSRAWVFQERYLAPRTLHFHQSELVMECQAGLRCECSGIDHFASNPLRNIHDISYASWYQVVEEFSRLDLTYESDRLESLMGVARVFWERLGCSYLHGIWEGDVAASLFWNVTRAVAYGIKSPVQATRQVKFVAPTWSWASLVISRGSRIYFPAGEGDTFHPDARFKLLNTDPPIDPGLFRNDSSAILIRGAFIEAIAFFPGAREEAETSHASLMFQENIEDAVLITLSDWNTDLPFGEQPEPGCWNVTCLLLGSAEEHDQDTEELVAFNYMLVLRESLDVPGSWERVGIINVEREAGVLWTFEEKVMRLV